MTFLLQTLALVGTLLSPIMAIDMDDGAYIGLAASNTRLNARQSTGSLHLLLSQVTLV